MSFLIKDDESLEKYNDILEKVWKENLIAIPKADFQYICWWITLLDSVFRSGKNYYSQTFIEKSKYVVKEKKISKYIVDDIEISSDSDKKIWWRNFW